MDAPVTKRSYAKLTIALTRWLNGDEAGARQLVGETTGSTEAARVRAVVEQDLRRLEHARPQWQARLDSFRQVIEHR